MSLLLFLSAGCLENDVHTVSEDPVGDDSDVPGTYVYDDEEGTAFSIDLEAVTLALEDAADQVLVLDPNLWIRAYTEAMAWRTTTVPTTTRTTWSSTATTTGTGAAAQRRVGNTTATPTATSTRSLSTAASISTGPMAGSAASWASNTRTAAHWTWRATSTHQTMRSVATATSTARSPAPFSGRGPSSKGPGSSGV